MPVWWWAVDGNVWSRVPEVPGGRVWVRRWPWLRRNLGELIETDEDPLDFLAQRRSQLEEQLKMHEQKVQQILNEFGDGTSG